MVGEAVFARPSGERFVRIDTVEGLRILQEKDVNDKSGIAPARFLRAVDQTTARLCAEGFVRVMADGHVLRLDDLKTYIKATIGRDFSPDDPLVQSTIDVIDEARVHRLVASSDMPDQLTLSNALALHENCQWYSSVDQRRMAALPLGVVAQYIARTRKAGERFKIVGEKRGEFSALIESEFQRTDANDANFVVGELSEHELPRALTRFGIEVKRNDHAALGSLVGDLPDNGLGVFIVGGDGSPGHIGPQSRRFLDAFAAHYEIEGIVDIDGAMLGGSNVAAKRMLIVGPRREKIGHGGLPPRIPYVTDYESLWGWANQVVQHIQTPGSVSYAARGGVSTDIVNEANSWQVPYIPASMLSDPSLMVPRNLSTHTRRAVLSAKEGIEDVDAWLAGTLDYDPKDLSEAFAAEQADAVLLGIKRFERGLGFAEGDQTGVGKGRALAAFARYARLQGIPVIFVTKSEDLFTDFYRDIEDIGAQHLFKNIVVMNDKSTVISPTTGELVAKTMPKAAQRKMLESMSYPESADLVVCTYSQFNRDPNVEVYAKKGLKKQGFSKLRPADQAQAVEDFLRDNPQYMEAAEIARKTGGVFNPFESINVQVSAHTLDPSLIKDLSAAAMRPLWLARAAEGTLLIMDESHEAAGESSQTNYNFMVAAVRSWNTVYSSATFARGERNMRIYRRLFPGSVDVENLATILERGGEAAQEALSSMLAEDGGFVRREHDLSNVQFIPDVDSARLQQNRDLADRMAEVLAALGAFTREARLYIESFSENKALGQAMQAATAAGGVAGMPAVDRFNSASSRMHILMREFLTLIKVPFTIEKAITALREGRKPVIVLDHTNEAMIGHAASSDDATVQEDGTIVLPTPSFRDAILRMVERTLKVKMADDVEIDLSQKREVAEALKLLRERIMDFPHFDISPIDIIRKAIEDAGYTCAELSGRGKRLVSMGEYSVVSTIPATEKRSARDRFNSGAVDGLILTRAGSTGKSMHASEKFLDRRQRELIELEIVEDVVQRVQFFGRVNRKGQVSHPLIRTLSSGLPAENRLLAMQNNKLRKLSANVTSNRDNAAITRNIADIINGVGNEVCYRFLQRNPSLAEKLDITLQEIEGEYELFYGAPKYTTRLLGRMVMLPVAEQEQVIAEITDEFNACSEELDQRGTNPLKSKMFDFKAKATSSRVLEKRSSSVDETAASAFDLPVYVTTIEYEETLEAMVPAEVKRYMKEGALLGDKRWQSMRGESFNVKKPFDTAIELLIERRDHILGRAKPPKFQTVALALADADANICKTLDEKIQILLGLLPEIRIGTAFKTTNSFDEERTCVIVSLTPPKLGLEHLPGQYGVTYVKPGSVWMHHASLHTLTNALNFTLLGSMNKEIEEEFRSVKHAVIPRTREVLTGNLFRGAEISLATKMGTPGMYSMDDGSWQRGVILPMDRSIESIVRMLPVRLTDKESIAEYLMTSPVAELNSAGDTAFFYGNEEGSRMRSIKGISLVRVSGDPMVHVVMSGKTQSVNWLKSNQAVMQITGPFHGDRRRLSATIAPSDVPDLLDKLYEAGITLYAGHGIGNPAKWFIERLDIKDRAFKESPKDEGQAKGTTLGRRRKAA